MAPNYSKDQVLGAPAGSLSPIPTFPMDSTLNTVEQKTRFELLRLAFFALKLRKLEQQPAEEREGKGEEDSQLEYHRRLLRHVIFQQVLTLIQLDARAQAFQIIEACRT